MFFKPIIRKICLFLRSRTKEPSDFIFKVTKTIYHDVIHAKKLPYYIYLQSETIKDIHMFFFCLFIT